MHPFTHTHTQTHTDRHTPTDRHTQTDRQTDRHTHTDRQAHTPQTHKRTQTDTHTDRHTQTDTHRQTHKLTDRHKHTQTDTHTQTRTTLKADNNTYTADVESTLNQLMDYFTPEDSASDDDAHHKRARQLTTEPMHTTDDIPFAKQEVQAALETFDPHKALGEDALNIEIFLQAFRRLPTFFTEVYNECLHRRHFPNYWKRSIIHLVVKPDKEGLSEVHKYRPISLINTGGKLLEKLLIDRVNHHLHTKLLNRNQFGFTPQKVQLMQ